jgi:RNA polymerase sigma-70 factor, ECF subfamily
MAPVEELLTHRDFMVTLARKYVRRQEVAEEIAQAGIVRALNSLDQFRGDCAMKSWLGTIVRNLCHNYHRAQKDLVNIDEMDLATPDPEPAHTQCFELRDQLKSEIEKLPPKQRAAVEMRIYMDMSFKDIAAVMNSPYDTAKANYRHGIERVKRIMRNEQ